MRLKVFLKDKNMLQRREQDRDLQGYFLFQHTQGPASHQQHGRCCRSLSLCLFQNKMHTSVPQIKFKIVVELNGVAA